MKVSIRYLLLAPAALLTAFSMAVCIGAQAPKQATVQTDAPPPPNDAVPTPGRAHLAPRHLTVLPKDTPPEKVGAIMREWGVALGVTCSDCHSEAKVRDIDGNIHNDMADDSKPEFKVARSMYRMTEDINSKFHISTTCGTCHRGHGIPEPFPASGSDLKVLSTIAFQRVFDEEFPTFNKASGHRASAEFGGGTAMANRVQSDEVADLYFGPRQNIDALVAAGKVRPDSVVDLARSPVGFAVKKGAPKPDVSTTDAFKKTLLAARGITYPDPTNGSPSANHLIRVAEQLGIADALKAKTRRPPGGGAGGPTMLITGEADLAFQQNCELLLTPGTELLGPLPREFQLITIMSVAVPVTAREPEAAKAFIRYLQTPAVAAVMKRWGLESIAPTGAATSTKQ